ncbi:MAG: hypothetical protein M1820_010801 [Bogoriella megaspora]|nr:MAG: hypothetical protein M1820_010801 [Bogoriella megaspora]
MPVNGSSTPLAGAVLCFTSISPEKRGELANIAESMGAAHRLDLTSDVTHLIVGQIDTLKYKHVAKSRPDVKVFAPNWIEAMRELWTSGEEIDIGLVENKFRLPTFYGLRQREEVHQAVEENGGQYEGNLTREVTHLIAAEPSGAKYNRARQWNLKIVSYKWLEDCLERGMVLDEGLYDPTAPVDQQGKGAWLRQVTTPTKRSRQATNGEKDPNAGRRKMRRTASSKLSSQNADIWGQISGADIPSRAVKEDSRWQSDDRPNEGTGSRRALEETSGNSPPKPRAPSVTDKSASAILPAQYPFLNNLPKEFLRGKTVIIYGFNSKRTEVVQVYLEGAGARVHKLSDTQTPAPESAAPDTYLMVPHEMDPESIRAVKSKLNITIIVTEWWLERCLEEKIFIDPSEHTLGRPLPKGSMKGFDGLNICTTLFAGLGLKHLAEACELFGASFRASFTLEVSVLVCGSTPLDDNGKYSAATRHGIPAVSAAWFYESIERGEKQPFDRYLITGKPVNQEPTPLPSSAGLGGYGAANPEIVPTLGQSMLNKAKRKGSPKPQNATVDVRNQVERNIDGAMRDINETGADQVQEPGFEKQDHPDQQIKGLDGSETYKKSLLLEASTIYNEELGGAISNLLAQKQSSRPSSAAEASTKDRKKRALGRAVSSGSKPNAGESFGRTSSLASESATASQRLDALDAPPRIEPIVPSQALSYENPGGQEQRDEMIRRLGGKVDESTRNAVGPIGQVKDLVVQESSVGKRVRRRAKMGQTREDG